ncbi:MAG: D-alanine--D-alanine ligase [Holdemanella sp.]|nr:D-alanine--D-alanine ligase [Holdemanella sp.]
MDKIKLGIVFGGQSSEYSVSLHSVGSVLRQVRTEKYEMTLIGIDKTGRTYITDASIEEIEEDQWQEKSTPAAWVHKGIIKLGKTNEVIALDCVFPVLHGKNGEDGCIQGLFELMNIHYVGCDVLSSAASMDKEITHILCENAGIPCAKYVCIRKTQTVPSFDELKQTLPLPWFIKPCSAGSSYGVHYVDNEADYMPAIEDAFYYDGRGKILVESMIKGLEIGCAVMGNEDIITGEVDEVRVTGHMYDFEGKYENNGASVHCPSSIPDEKRQEARVFAKKTYIAMNCCGLARVDMFLTEDNEIVLNELNTIPGFTATSRYPSMMKSIGIDFPDLIDRLVELALQRTISAC